MTDPNATQVGGAHYSAPYQHWDFVYEALAGDYLTGCMTKYVARWRKKNGLEDLLKSGHYLQKLDAQRAAHPWFHRVRREIFVLFMGRDNLLAKAQRFSEANELTDMEREVMLRAATWTAAKELTAINATLQALVTLASVEEVG